ncbi:MAG: hypothetical protein K0R07_1543 [Sedimentibacter sp.]|nr:hypothetical protein [Sedimentibacter sp.]
MKKQRRYKRIMAIALTVLMLTLSIQQPVQAKSISADWSQLANEEGSEEWIYGNLNSNKSVYVEGMSVPQRLVISDITSGSGIRSVDFEYQFTKSGQYAYDFITSWDQAKEAASDYLGQNWKNSWLWNDTGIDTTNLQNNYVDISIPTNNYATSKENAYEGLYGDRTIRIYSSEPITDVSIDMNNNLDGSEDSDSKLGFSVSWQGNASEIMILYASHIALGDNSSIGWGDGNGAGEISGSPYHNYLTGSTEWSGQKSMDNQLQIDYEVAEVQGMKWADSNGDGIRNNDEVGLENWQIWADYDEDGKLDAGEPTAKTSANGSYTLKVLAPLKGSSNVRIYETQKSGYIQTYPSENQYHELTIEKGSEYRDIDFGNYKATASISVTKTANPSTMDEPGGVFTYTYVVTNTGNVPLTLTSVVDDVIGEITLPMDLYLEAGESTEEMTGTKTYTRPGEYKNTVIATATIDDNNKPITATDEAIVTVKDILPKIKVTKVASPTNLPKGGGLFTYKFVVTNNGEVPVTLTSVFDNVIGEINLPNDVELLPGESTEEMTANWTHTQSGTHSNTVTATAMDEDENEVSATADASVFVSNNDASITVTKTPNPLTLPEPGGEFTYTYIITNNGNIPVTLKSVIDDQIGAIELPEIKTIEPGKSVTLIGKKTYTDDGTYVNKVTVTAVFDGENELTAETTASVTVTDTKPSITVVKTASPTSLPLPGGVFTYTFAVTNNGNVPITITNVHDDKIGNITLPEDTELLPGESMTLTASKEYTVAGTYKNIVSVTAVDDDNNTITETDDASVTVTVPGGEDPQDPDEPEEPDDDPEEPEESEITPIDDTEVPLSGEPVLEPVEPEEAIEEAIVPLATLPDTGNFFNNTILFIIGAFLLTSGVVLNKRKKIKQ